MTSKSKKTDIVSEGVVEDTPIMTFNDLESEDGLVLLDDLDTAFEILDTTEEVTPDTTFDFAPSPEDTSGVSHLIVDIDDDIEYLTWLIYGKNGTGKTTLLSTVDNMLILAAEDGTLSIREKAKGNAKKIRIDSWDKIEEVYWLLKRGTWKDGGVYIKVKGGSFLVKSLGFDTITKLAEVCMRNIVLGDKAKDVKKDVITKTMKNWGDMSEKLKYWLQTFKDLPLQKVWLCQESTNAEDLESEEYTIFPAVNKSLRLYVQSEADIIGRTFIKQVETGKVQFRMSVAPNPTYVTKDRTNLLGGVIPNPKLNKLYDKVFNEPK